MTLAAPFATPFRTRMLAGTILGAGLLSGFALGLRPRQAMAGDITIPVTTPVTNLTSPSSIVGAATGADAITVTTSGAGTIQIGGTGVVGISASSVDGKVTVTADATTNPAPPAVGVSIVSGPPAILAVSTGKGSVQVDGSGNVRSNGATSYAISASAFNGSVTVSGSGNSKGDLGGIRAGVGIKYKDFGQQPGTNPGANGTITIDRSGSSNGISAENYGSGRTTISGVGEVTESGIKTNSFNGDTAITLGAAVTGGTNGINASVSSVTTGGVTTAGTGGISITSTASITGGAGAGVLASAKGGAIDIGGTAGLSGSVSGGTGISATNTGSGKVDVKTSAGGTVTGSTSEGITTTAATGATTIDAGAAVSGVTAGVSATSTTGPITVTGAGDVSGIGANATGVLATSTSGAITISGSGKTTATGTANAIDAQMTGTGTNGTITISRSGDVTADQGKGIYAQNVGPSGVGAGKGDITLAGIGKVTSTGAEAISLVSNGNIQAGTSSDKLNGAISGTTGINAQTTGASTIAVRTDTGGTVSGTSAEGIKTTALNSDTTINLGAKVTGATDGVSATVTSGGTGGITIASTAEIAGGTGAGVKTSAVSGTTTITLGDAVRGKTDAVRAEATGAGDIAITSTARVASESKATSTDTTYADGTGSGIYANSKGGNVQIGTAAAKISGEVKGATGISATTNNNGTIDVRTATGGVVTGTTGTGIATSAGIGDTKIDLSAQVSGADSGVTAVSGTGKITITSSAQVTGGTSFGISAISDGAITITGSGGTSSTDQAAIRAYVRGGNADITVNRSGTVFSQSGNGIDAQTGGDGKIVIGGIGAVTGGEADDKFGVLASSNGGHIEIGQTGTGLSKAISGGNGISASTVGSGDVSVRTTAGGIVTGKEAGGITTQAANGSTTISLGADVEGKTSGVSAIASGSGTVTITSTAGIRSTGGSGVSVSALGGGNIAVGGVSGLAGTISGQTGINAETKGSGQIAISTKAGSSVTGTVGSGVQTIAVNGATTLDIGGDVSGKQYAIQATSKAAGTIDVTLRAGATASRDTGAVLFEMGGTGNAALTNYGTINASLKAQKKGRDSTGTFELDGTGKATVDNYGTVSLLGTKSITGFDAVNNKSGGVLTGTGSFGPVTAESGSFIRPGDRSLPAVDGVPQMGVMKMSSLTMQAGSTLAIRVDGSADNVNDRLDVTGAASLGGAKLDVAATPTSSSLWNTVRTYRVLNAASVDGVFAVKTDLAFLTPTAVYGAKTVDLTFRRNVTTFQSVGETPTQKGVGQVIQSKQETPSEPAKKFVEVMTNLTAPQAKDAMDTLSGSGQSGAAATVTGQFYGFTAQVVTEARTSPLGSLAASGPTAFSGSDMPLAYSAPEVTGALAGPFGGLGKSSKGAGLSPVQTWRIWTSVFGASHSVDPQASRGSPGVTWHDWSGATGFETAVSPGIIAGVAVGGSSSPFSAGKRATTGESTGGMGSVYTFATLGNLYATASLGYGRFETKTVRTIAIPGAPVERQSVRYGTDSYDAFLELGWRMSIGQIVAMPFANVHPGILRHEAAVESSEQSGALFGLSYAARDTKTLPASLGLQVGTSFGLGENWTLLAEGRAAWVHEFSPKRQVRASFLSLPGGSFVADGVYAVEDLARFTATVNAVNVGGFSLFARAGADVSPTSRSYSGQAGLRMAW